MATFPLLFVRSFYEIFTVQAIDKMDGQTVQVSQKPDQKCRLYRVNKKKTNGHADGWMDNGNHAMTQALLTFSQ